jgi:hypothetical protein
MDAKDILPSIVTTSPDWPEKIKEADELGIKEIALFPTFLKKDQRQPLYDLLAKSKIERIPFVHIRGDFDLAEMDFFAREWRTEVFNTHPFEPHPYISEYYKKIYLENVVKLFNEEELNGYAGVCVDFSHLRNDKLLHPERFEAYSKAILSHTIGCNHIGGMREEKSFNKNANEDRCDSHFLNDLSELDHLKDYPEQYFSKFIALEMENDLKTQLRAKEYILNLRS